MQRLASYKLIKEKSKPSFFKQEMNVYIEKNTKDGNQLSLGVDLENFGTNVLILRLLLEMTRRLISNVQDDLSSQKPSGQVSFSSVRERHRQRIGLCSPSSGGETWRIT